MKNIEDYTNDELIEIVRDFGTTDMVRAACAGELAARAADIAPAPGVTV